MVRPGGGYRRGIRDAVEGFRGSSVGEILSDCERGCAISALAQDGRRGSGTDYTLLRSLD